ncbi:pyridoxal-phosphate dependent enzyme, partial [Candidatus Sumerlaeota bacterium]|nr:pyridoxal-phosphate dependent enzyme [Candidatus Sumerlaeota bacterium]
THAGLLFGLRAMGSTIPVTGVCVRRDAESQTRRIREHCHGIARLLDVRSAVADTDIRLMDAFLAPGYGVLTDSVVEALSLAARDEGLILDPVYTAKAMAGCIERARDSSETQGRRLLFVHTGGQPALFAYERALTEAFKSDDEYGARAVSPPR